MAQSTCSVDGCGKRLHASGLCSMHFSRLRRRGEVGGPEPLRLRQSGACEVVGCEHAATKRGLCDAHYGAARLADPASPECGIDGCERRVYGNGMCRMHWKRVRKTGIPGDAIPLRRPGAACDVEGCDRPHSRWGYCAMHYQRVRDTGEAGIAEPKFRAPGTGTRRVADGYIMITVDGRQRMQHRVVMEQMLGRPLRDFENVHHRNGIRDDNSPENLELWVKPQPCGQRADDLAQWVVECYPELVRAMLDERNQLQLTT